MPGTTPERTALAQERPREAIVRVATQLFGERSYPAVTMRDIASGVGILAGSLYAHIDSKENLLLEIIEGGVNDFIFAVQAAASSPGGADEHLRAMILAHVRVVAANPQRTLIVFHQWRYLDAANQTRVRERRRLYEQLFTAAVTEGVKSGVFAEDLNVRIAVLTILGALNWTPEWLSPKGQSSVNQIGASLGDTLLNGVLKVPSTGGPAKKAPAKRLAKKA